MRICIITPAPPRSRQGNRITALRLQSLLRQLGHHVTVATQLNRRSTSCELLVALHARKSHPALAAFKEQHPNRPAIVALTGTDLYQDVQEENREALASLAMAD